MSRVDAARHVACLRPAQLRQDTRRVLRVSRLAVEMLWVLHPHCFMRAGWAPNPKSKIVQV